MPVFWQIIKCKRSLIVGRIIKCKRSLIVGSPTNKHLHQGAPIRYITKQHETLDTNNLHSCFIFNHPEISGFLNNDDCWTIFITLNKGVVCMTHHVSSRSITEVSINMLKAFLEFDSWQRTTHLLIVLKRNSWNRTICALRMTACGN